MWKRIALVLAGSLLLIPFAVFADNVGVASATIDFDAVVNMLIAQDWDGITIDQPWINTLFTTLGPGDMPLAWGAGTAYNIRVTVQALSDFNVYAGYSSDTTDFVDVVGTEDSFIALADLTAGTRAADTDYVASLPTLSDLTTPRPDTGTPFQTGGAVAGALTLLGGWSGVNSLPTGEVRDYDVFWNPMELKGDLATGADRLEIDIYFLVTDPTV